MYTTRERVQERLNALLDSFVLNGTHTHSGPERYFIQCSMDDRYRAIESETAPENVDLCGLGLALCGINEELLCLTPPQKN